jgi:hypothetical protein
MKGHSTETFMESIRKTRSEKLAVVALKWRPENSILSEVKS